MNPTIKWFLVSVLISFTVLNVYQANFLMTNIKSKQLNPSTDGNTNTNDNNKNNVKNNLEHVNVNEQIIHSLPRKNIYSLKAIEDRLAYHFPYREQDSTEQNIFQLWKSQDVPADTELLMERWREANDEYDYHFLTIDEAEDFVVDFLRPRVPEVIDALRALPNQRLKFEFLKYLLVFIEGGVYADIDTINIKPVRFWWHSPMLKTKFWIGVDSDFNNPSWSNHYVRRLTFNTNLFRAKAHHPLLRRVISRIVLITFTQSNLIKSINWDEQYETIDANGNPLIQFTGQLLFTDAAFEYMNSINEAPYFTSMENKNHGGVSNGLSKKIYGPYVDPDQRFSYKTFSLMASPVQVYDLCILPHVSFNGFESAERDVYDDDNSKKGLDKIYYARGKDLTEWSQKRLKLDSN